MNGATPSATLRHAAGLCAIAGFVDAVGYFQFGHVFTANMTGNTVLLGASLVRTEPIAWTYAATIAAFALGVVVAVLVKRHLRSLAAAFVADAALLIAVALLAPSKTVVLLALAFAMGIQGGTLSSFSGIRLPTVVVTSTLVNLVEGAVNRTAPAGNSQPTPSNDNLRHLAVAWLAYGIGGAAAVLVEGLSAPLLVPAALYLIVAADLARLARH